MAYHKAKEEYRWKQWKEEEEKQLRALGMDEKAIQELRYSDWKDFKAERCYQEHRAAFPEYPDWESPATEDQETEDISAVLDSISDEGLLHILMTTDKKTLQLLLLKMMGFSRREISEKTGISIHTINTRIKRLRKK